MGVAQATGSIIRNGTTANPDTVEAERRERASLRRLAVGEQRKRSSRIAEALCAGSFALRYLPRLDLSASGDRMTSAELWLGLPNRRRGLVSIAPILRGLDRKALRSRMLSFMIRAAVSELGTWPPSWRIAIPVPGQTLGDGAVCEIVLDALHDTGISAEQIDLLIDETELVEGGSAMRQEVVVLREQGIGITLEGFGAIFGSLALLPRLPLTGLRLDRRLAHATVSDGYADEMTFIGAAVEIARRFDARVAIDGIETELELEGARRLGLDQVQGPWVGPAMPAEVIRARIRQSN